MFPQLLAYPDFGKHCSGWLIFAPESSYLTTPTAGLLAEAYNFFGMRPARNA
jgi:hypothetical protein